MLVNSPEGAETIAHDDRDWPVVNTPHGLEFLPLEASGGVNYQGEAWYRKHFVVPADLQGQRVVLRFEGLMGKSGSSPRRRNSTAVVIALAENRRTKCDLAVFKQPFKKLRLTIK